jgi:hypothetical protein
MQTLQQLNAPLRNLFLFGVARSPGATSQHIYLT